MPKLNMEIINAIATLIVVAVIAWAKVKERKLAKAAGLLANPERCEQHQTRLAVIEERLDTIEEDIKEIKEKLE